MPVRTTFFPFLLGGLYLSVLSCEEGKDEFTVQYTEICQVLNCGDGVDISACTDLYVAWKEEALEIGDVCGKQYIAMIECVHDIRECSPNQDLGTVAR